MSERKRYVRAAMTNMPSAIPSASPFCNGGFTLVEFVITIIVIGILSAVVLPYINATAQRSVLTQADEFRRNLSHIQLMAISQSQRMRMSVNSGGTNYTVVSCANSACSATSPVTDPATGANFSVNMTNGVTLAPAGSNLDFDSLGRPQTGGSLSTSAKTYTLGASGLSVPVSVLPITGFAS
jgi:MSHA pilin protein MshC